MKKLLTLIVVLFIVGCCNISIAQKYPDIENVTFVRNYDGDTITVDIDGWPSIIGDDISIRVRGIDTPEIRGKCPKERDIAYMVKRFVYLELVNAKSIMISNPEKDKYFRILGDVEYDGKNLLDELIKRGYGYRYNGGKKRNPWCDDSRGFITEYDN